MVSRSRQAAGEQGRGRANAKDECASGHRFAITWARSAHPRSLVPQLNLCSVASGHGDTEQSIGLG